MSPPKKRPTLHWINGPLGPLATGAPIRNRRWLSTEAKNYILRKCISQTNTFPHEGSKNLEELLGNRPPAIPPNWLGTFQPRQHPPSYHGLEGLVHNWRCMPVSKWAIMIIAILTANPSNHINYRFAWQAWPCHLWHWAGSGGALGLGLVAGDAAALCMAGVALGDIHLRFTWQAWHLETSTFVLRRRRGRRGTYGTGLAWHAWHLVTSTFVLRGRRGPWSHPPSFCVAGVALMEMGWLWCHTLSLSHTIFHTPSLTHHLSHTIFDTPSFKTLSRTIFVTQHLSHTIFHTPSFTPNFVTHHLWHTIFHTPHCHPPSLTHHLSNTTLSHTIFHTPSLTHHLWHTIFHTTLSHIFHTPSQTIFHTPSFAHHLWHTIFQHTILHTPLCHTPSFTTPSFRHNFVAHHLSPHHLSHTTLSHTTFRHTIFHTPLCHTPSFTHNFVTRSLSHTTFTHTIFHTQLCHTHTIFFVTHHLSHTTLSHTALFYFSILHHLLCLSFLPRPSYKIWCLLLEEVALWGYPVL